MGDRTLNIQHRGVCRKGIKAKLRRSNPVIRTSVVVKSVGKLDKEICKRVYRLVHSDYSIPVPSAISGDDAPRYTRATNVNTEQQ